MPQRAASVKSMNLKIVQFKKKDEANNEVITNTVLSSFSNQLLFDKMKVKYQAKHFLFYTELKTQSAMRWQAMRFVTGLRWWHSFSWSLIFLTAGLKICDIGESNSSRLARRGSRTVFWAGRARGCRTRVNCQPPGLPSQIPAPSANYKCICEETNSRPQHRWMCGEAISITHHEENESR